MAPKRIPPIASPSLKPAQKKAKLSNLELFYTNYKPGGAYFDKINAPYFSELVRAEIKKLTKDEQVSVVQKFTDLDADANLLQLSAKEHFERVCDYSSEGYDQGYLKSLKIWTIRMAKPNTDSLTNN